MEHSFSKHSNLERQTEAETEMKGGKIWRRSFGKRKGREKDKDRDEENNVNKKRNRKRKIQIGLYEILEVGNDGTRGAGGRSKLL